MQIRTPLQQKIIDVISDPGERSHQKSVGPSEIGGCAYCLGKRVAGKFPDLYPDIKHEAQANYPAWLGTAVHFYLEHHIPFGEHEIKVPITEIEGYGTVSGHLDLWADGEIIDFKNLGAASTKKAALLHKKNPGIIPSVPYRVQQHLYGYGAKKLGYEVTHVQLMILPKTGKTFNDIVFYREPYDESVATRALDRLEKIVQYVRGGRLEELPEDDDCYNCNSYY